MALLAVAVLLSLTFLALVKWLAPRFMSFVATKLSGLATSVESVHFFRLAVSTVSVQDRGLSLRLRRIHLGPSLSSWLKGRPFLTITLTGIKINVATLESRGRARRVDVVARKVMDVSTAFMGTLLNKISLSFRDVHLTARLSEGDDVLELGSERIDLRSLEDDDAWHAVLSLRQCELTYRRGESVCHCALPSLDVKGNASNYFSAQDISLQVGLSLSDVVVPMLLQGLPVAARKKLMQSSHEVRISKVLLSLSNRLEEIDLDISTEGLSLRAAAAAAGDCETASIDSVKVQCTRNVWTLECSQGLLSFSCFGMVDACYTATLVKASLICDTCKTLRITLLKVSLDDAASPDLLFVEHFEFNDASNKVLVKSVTACPSRRDISCAIVLASAIPKSEAGTKKETGNFLLVAEIQNSAIYLCIDEKRIVDLRGQCQKISFQATSSSTWTLKMKQFRIHDKRGKTDILENVRCIKMVKTQASFKVSFKANVVCHWQPYIQKHVLEWCEAENLFAKVASINQRSPTASSCSLLIATKECEVNFYCNNTILHLIASSAVLAKDSEWSLKMPAISVGLCEKGNMLKFTQVILTFSKDMDNFRQDMDSKLETSNDCLKISLASLVLRFPYEYDVYEALSNDVLGYIKWSKAMIARNRLKTGHRLEPDVVIFVKNVSIELPDDNFEVRLRDNYELMEDEYYESEKRRQCLREKINELMSSQIILPSAKVEELHSNLSRKNADIYIQRSKNLNTMANRRTRLMELSVTSLKLVILADSSMNDLTSLKHFITDMEKDSRLPESLRISTFHFRWIRFECKSALFRLRDFTQPFIEMSHVLLWGKVALAEQVSASREIRVQPIHLNHPLLEDDSVERGLQPLKVYTDLAMDMGYFVFSHGPCWEPVVSQVSIALSYLTGIRKIDPSPPLVWWDKVRYIFHGRLLWSVKMLKMFLHTSLDPYNTTEEIEANFSDGNFQFLNNSILKCSSASLDMFVRTASKYDDCRLIHIPKIEIVFHFTWSCLGDAEDHYSVVMCTKESMPEFSSNEQHDSFRAFRSHSVNVRVGLDAKTAAAGGVDDRATIHMFSSTIRWMESLKWLFSGTSRPIRRGKCFSLEEVKKKSLFRHFKEVIISQNLNELDLDYWTSASMTKGILVRVTKGFSLSGKYILQLVDSMDGLLHRPKSNWMNQSTNCQLDGIDVWFQCSGSTEAGRIVEKNFFFSVANVQYDRQMQLSRQTGLQELDPGAPFHRLTVTGAKCAWTISNRDMTFSLYESWWRAHILREQLSAEALKAANFKIPGPQNALEEAAVLTEGRNKKDNNTLSGELSLSTLTFWKGNEMIEDLSEGSNFATVFDQADQYSSGDGNESRAMMTCLKDDIVRRSWLIKFVNCQVLLKGSETQGYLILSASKAEAKKTIHKPVWKGDTILSKTSWSGLLEDMQYFATVSPNSLDVRMEEISWLPLEAIEEDKGSFCLQQHVDYASGGMVDDGYGSVGGVVAQLGPEQLQQLQRIVSKCKCEFYHVTFGDELLEDIITEDIFQPAQESIWGDSNQFTNCFSLVHHDLNVCTNSLQYSVILDVLNNLLLFVDPTLLSRTENYMRTKYKLLLSNIEDQKKPIIHLQSSLRQLICQLRSKEKHIYHVRNGSNSQQTNTLEELEKAVHSLKELVSSKSEELNVRLRCYHDFQLSQCKKYSLPMGEAKADLRQKSDIFFSRAQWRLTETDGQLGIADVAIGNFSYAKSIMKDDSTEHLLEMGHVSVKNLLRDQLYVDVLSPTTLQNVPLDRQRTLRVFCREKAPVGGISVKDHFEINVVPLTIGITQNFYKKIVGFCFPDRNIDQSSSEEGNTMERARRSIDAKKKNSNFYVETPLGSDDVEQMKERAKLNKLFIYIKIPEVPIRVSFKGEKEKNKILDVSNFVLQVPTIEYHNVTWTWLDFLMAVKSQTKDSLISQAIKQKLTIKSSSKQEAKKVIHDDEEKAKLLFGNILLLPNKSK